MALKGLDIFKLTPKTNCKDCGNPTCMAFAMKVASGALSIDKCPHMSPEALATLSEATAPPMKSYKVGELSLGGETVLSRHEKTLVSKTLYAVQVCDCMDEAKQDAVLAAIPNVDYERISERMYVEMIYVRHSADKTPADYAALVTKAKALGRPLVLSCTDLEAAKAGVEAASGVPFILNGATADNYADMSALAKGAKALLGVRAESLEALHQVVEKLEAAGNKDLILDVGEASIKDAYANAVQIRRAALKDGDRTFGYPSIVNVAGLAGGDAHLEAALLSLFTCKYGSIVVCSEMTYAKALPLYGLRQNIFTDPQKPMKVAPGIYPINGADENSPCCLTVDFALTYFLVSGELERSKMPVNLLITDASGMSVLTAWAAGKFSSSSIKKFFDEFDINNKIKSRALIIPGKVAVMKGEIQEKLPGWNVVVGPLEAVQLPKYMKDKEYEAAAKAPGKTGDNLLIAVERRLDNVVYRLGFATTRRDARQLVTHGHFTVNGKKVDIPSYLVKVGDVIEVREKSRSSVKFKGLVGEDAPMVTVPKWLERAKNTLQGKVVSLPVRDDIDFPVEEHLIVELYSK